MGRSVERTIVTGANGNYPIKPKDINGNKHFFEAFGNAETETSAGWIVRFCQRHGNWTPFSYEQIDRFYEESGYEDFRFNNLVAEGWIVEKKDGRFFITHDFITRCFLSSPSVASFGKKTSIFLKVFKLWQK